MNHSDEGTMTKNDIEPWFFFNEIMATSMKRILMDGDD